MDKKRWQNGKWTATALLLVLLLIVSACSGNNTNSGTKTNVDSPTENANDENTGSESGGIVEITVWDAPKPEDPHKPFMEERFAEFDKANPNIKVTRELMPEGTNDREVFVTAMAGGNGPDAYQNAHFPIIGDWVAQGMALDISSYWDGFADKSQFIDSSQLSSTIDGKVYGVPWDMYVTGLLWNKNLFEDVGLDRNTPPANWDELVSFGKQLTIPDKKQYGLTLLGMEWADWWFEYYVWQAGGDLTAVNPDGTVELTFTEEPSVTALQFYKDLKWTHKMVQTNVLQSYQDNTNDLYQGRAAMTNGLSSAFGDYAANGLDLNSLGFAPYPVGPGGRGPGQIGGAYWIINPKSSKEEQDAAWEYITFMTSKEHMEQKLQYQKDNGIFPNLLSVRKDINPADYTENVPQDLVDGVNKAASDTQLEYFLKERLTPYVVKAVQIVLTDEKADPMIVLEAAQQAAQKEVVDAYNAEVKK